MMAYKYTLNFKQIVSIAVIGTIFLYNLQIYAQEKEQSPSNVKKTKLRYDAFSYSGLKTSEQHSYFKLSYKINSNLFAELGGQYDSYLFADVFKVPLTIRYKASKKLYFFSGAELELTRNLLEDFGKAAPLWKFTGGMGYEVNSNFLLEAKHDLNFDTSNLGIYGTPSLLSIKGRYRF